MTKHSAFRAQLQLPAAQVLHGVHEPTEALLHTTCARVACWSVTVCSLERQSGRKHPWTTGFTHAQLGRGKLRHQQLRRRPQQFRRKPNSAWMTECSLAFFFHSFNLSINDRSQVEVPEVVSHQNTPAEPSIRPLQQSFPLFATARRRCCPARQIWIQDRV